jgi:thioesterase domain-containing protein
MSILIDELQSIWREQIPLTTAIGVAIERYTNDELVLRAALAPNLNLHGTAFGGSLYSVCALAGWGMTWLQLRGRNLDGRIVLAEGRITYRRAVAEDIVCRCRFDPAEQLANLEQLAKTGSGLFPLLCGVDAGGRRAVRFEGEYSVRIERPSDDEGPPA